MKIGTVKWFNAQKGYGFITDEAGTDVFFHYSALNMKGFKTVVEGQTVKFELAEGTRGTQAVNITIC